MVYATKDLPFLQKDLTFCDYYNSLLLYIQREEFLRNSQ